LYEYSHIRAPQLAHPACDALLRVCDSYLETVVEIERAGRTELDAYTAALAELTDDGVPMPLGPD
jgi:hypothetical protein